MKNLFDLDSLPNKKIISLIKAASVFDISNKSISNSLKDKAIGILFFEPSTRTKYSFEIAAKRLGAKTFTFSADNTSSLAKGEDFYDTIKTFENLGSDLLIIRHPQKNYYKKLKNIYIPILSGGDGSGSHPSQSLLDLLTIYKEFNKFEGLKIAIIGDVKHSRVARSNIKVMKRLGMEVLTSAPANFQVENVENISLAKAIKNCDVLMAIRTQFERHDKDQKISKETFNEKYGLNLKNLKNKKQTSIIMHPGPVNWGMELTKEVKEHSASRINEQVENGLLIRAVLLLEVFNVSY